MSVSPPPTPPARGPESDERRFVDNHDPCEWIEDYHPGGYHPVHLDDHLNDGRYKIVRKLGEGSSSTVWLARDLRCSRYVTVKILKSKYLASTVEQQILKYLAQAAPTKSCQHITQLLDEFEQQGPNGIHKCLVLEPMGPNVDFLTRKMPQVVPRKLNMKDRYPPLIAKRIIKQLLEAISFLYEHGVAHGDLQPGNMLFVLEDIDSQPEEALRQKEDVGSQSISSPIKRKDGKQDLWAPRYLCIAQPLEPFTKDEPEFRIKLSDMGGAYFFTDPPAELVTPSGLRPPELVLTEAIDKSLDVWSFGCLVFELITGRQLCLLGWDDGNLDDEYLLFLTERLGPLPDELYKHWETSHLYFTAERKLYNSMVGDEEEPEVLDQETMEEYFDSLKPELDEDEASEIKAFIRRILQYDPAMRPTPAELLQDPWIQKIR